MWNFFSCVSPRASTSAPRFSSTSKASIHVEEFKNRQIQLRHKIIEEQNFADGVLRYKVQRNETTFLENCTETTNISELELNIAQLLSEEDGLKLLQGWYAKQNVKDGTFSYIHRIVDQKDSAKGELYGVERETCPKVGGRSSKEIFWASVQTMLESEVGGALLDQWKNPSVRRKGSLWRKQASHRG